MSLRDELAEVMIERAWDDDSLVSMTTTVDPLPVSLREELAQEIRKGLMSDGGLIAESDLRAADAVLSFFASRGDVTEEQIVDAVMPQPHTGSAEKVRSLLAAQAARYAAEIAELRAEYAQLRQNIYDKPKYDTQTKALAAAEAERDALQAEVREVTMEREVYKADRTRLQARTDGALSPEGIERADVADLRQSLVELSPSPAQMIVDERDALQAQLAGVRYVRDNYITSGNIGHSDVRVVLLSSLDAALGDLP